ncbi:MAG: histidine--tRNA ligase [Firmicutes bacterium HGW-Firmicutes-9]|jgi:histidyl-tRNA synthetase|nr:MAG: histidine--tRNA ligase [Firmicutes bacterium HGW-Firmicutes-9]
MAAYKAPKGTRDVLPEQSYQWQFLEARIREIVKKYGFLETRTPVFEHTELFLRGVGETTDIVQKEMYTFLDKGERSVTLKPEGTAGVVRMFVENNLFGDTQPTKMFYLYSPTFRYERPQAGRLREHHQFGVEFFGSPKPSADAECIAVATELLSSLGCGGLTVRLNSIGDPNCRPHYHEALKSYLHEHYDDLCDTCKVRLETNPLRVLDCKVESCQKIANGAPVIGDYLCDECRDHQSQLLRLLDGMGINYIIDPRLVRGLDYYTKTVFEITSESIGSQSAVCGGGRYDGLVEEIGGPHTPAVGFGLGMERLLLVLENTGYQIEKPVRYDLYIASMGLEAEERAFLLANSFRKAGSKVEVDHIGRSVKSQLKYADKIGARYVLVLGGDELAKGEAKLKRMSDGNETITALDADHIQKLMI